MQAFQACLNRQSLLRAGIVGLPNVGTSTLFNAITRTRNAEAANDPFCTIDPNISIVSVPDARLAELKRIAKTNVVISAAIEFVDIAGLVKGASQGEGLGNKFGAAGLHHHGFNEAAAFRQRKYRPPESSSRGPFASMRPLLFGSGNICVSTMMDTTCWLQ